MIILGKRVDGGTTLERTTTFDGVEMLSMIEWRIVASEGFENLLPGKIIEMILPEGVQIG